MVRRRDNGNLYWLQDIAGIIEVTKEDPSQYNPALETEDMQINAELENNTNGVNYNNSIAKLQESVDASRPIPGIPPQPMYIVVTDPHMDGTIVTPGVRSETPVWPDPGLAKLKPKLIYPSGGGPPVEEEIVIEGQEPEPPLMKKATPPHDPPTHSSGINPGGKHQNHETATTTTTKKK